jgi:uncharacterized iron-regulated membrane protein
MSSDLLDPPVDALEPEPGAGSRGRKRRWRVKPLWIRTHRWVSLVVGLMLIAECTSGAVVLFKQEIEDWIHPGRYQDTHSASPMSKIDALAMVQREHPEIGPHTVSEFSGAYIVTGGDGSWNAPSAYVDPGARTINDIGHDTWFTSFMINLHDCALACEGYPLYWSFMGKDVPWVGGEHTVESFVLGGIAVLLLFLVISGLVIWWPAIREWAGAFRVRRGRGGYVRDLDLHKVVGVIALPFLFMWAYTGAAFFFHWTEQAYYAVLPGSPLPEEGVPEVGTGKLLTPAEAVAAAHELHPGMKVVSIYGADADAEGGQYYVNLDDPNRYDPYAHSYYGGDVYLTVDAHGGGVTEWPYADGPPTEKFWNNGVTYGLHFGSVVTWPWRLIWLAFGLTPILLAITGTTVWLVKRRSRRNRKAARADSPA